MLVDQVSDFDAADTDALVLMWRQSFEHALGITDPNPLERQRGYFETEIRPHARVQVVKRHGKLVAFLAAHERYLAQRHQARPGGTQYIFASPELASCCCRPGARM